MLFEIPEDITNYLAVLDDFIEREINPIEARDDNTRFFDHRREDARTDWDREGLPNEEWWALLGEMRDVADKAGHYRYAIPEEFGGRNGSNLSMAVIRHHLAHKGLGLHNDLQNESSIVGNLVQVLMLRDFGTDSQKRDFIPPMLEGKMAWSFGLTEAAHGSDATHMETRAVPEMRDGVAGYRIDGEKMWITGVHKTSHVMTFARTNGEDGKARGITCFVVPVDTPGFDIGQYMWTFNMPTDHAKIAYNGVWVSESAILGELDNGLAVAQHFVHENRIRQAASSLGAAQYCIDEAVKYARERKPFGKALATNQGIQFPLVELQTDAEMLRLLIYKTAAEMDTMTKPEVAIRLSDKVSMCNYKANRLCCNAADFAMQVHGGMGYSRHKPFEHIYRHHRRYRITEGAEEIQMRKVAEHLFGFMG
jgi:acyl-CoA dehydrogenase